ncbi:hypothetical protein ACIA48_17975 [Mycobacterium sp. NPDC051804]|uniref:hypothetical protein n=1 Tax=Mycobacterium sp. NPDC051804 TaxID=3364295 RepID=UPI0037A70FF2
MTKLHAQMALFGAIDDIVRNTDDVEIVATVESFMPGLTGYGKRGWFGELKEFLARPELAPRVPPSSEEPRTAENIFPPLAEAIDELEIPPSAPPSSEPPPPPPPPPPDGELPGADEQTPKDVARMMLASTILGKLRDLAVAKSGAPPLGLEFPDDADPLMKLLPRRINELPTGGRSIPGMDPVLVVDDPVRAVRDYLTNSVDLTQFQLRMQTLADHNVIDQGVAQGKPLCTGGLRKINGQYCSVLTTDHDEPGLNVGHVKRIMEPHNWPTLCPSFFRKMEDQNPDTTRGWTRVLEVVSADPTLWELRTALRYWKGKTTPDGGFYINYDLDPVRTGDGMMVEVDAGYLLITPLDPKNPDAGVRIRTSKQVRIRGVSATAAAVLACFVGWGDISTRMLTERAKPPFTGLADFGNLSKDPGKPKGETGGAALVVDAEAAAQRTALPPKWRGALISGFQTEFTKFMGVATDGASDFYRRWSDGMTATDIKEFGADFGGKWTAYAAGLLNAATNATTEPDPSDMKGGGQ